MTVGGATRPVKLKAPKDGVNKSGRRKLPPANALEAQGTSKFGTFGEDERFLANLMLQQNIRETDLREVVDESLQYLDERRAHWMTESAKAPHDKQAGRGFGAVLDWGDGIHPAKVEAGLMSKRKLAKEAARRKQ